MNSIRWAGTCLVLTLLGAPTHAQDPGTGGPPPGGPPRGFRGPMETFHELVARFDANGDGRLDRAERDAARAWLSEQDDVGGPFGGRRPPGGPGGPGGGRREAPGPGQRIEVSSVAPIEAPLFDPSVLRTIFIDFAEDDWEAELEAFKPTDVEVPATLVVDGRRLPGVGVSFRGASSYFMIGTGSKRSLNLSIDFTHEDLRLDGQRTLNLLNGNGDPSFMRTVLFSHVAAAHLPVPKANLVRVVINGENWGVYANVQQFNRDFLAEHFPSAKGARWKVPGSPRGDGGLRDLGDDLEPYRERFEIKSKDDPKDWAALVRLCRTLCDTPIDELEVALAPMLDLDEAIWFLALDCALVNEDGYWVRASDYNLFLDEHGVFHLVPHDMNESFHEGGGFGPGGPGRGGFGPPPRRAGDEGGAPDDAPAAPPEDARRRGRRGGPGGPGGMRIGADLDPFIGLDDDAKPLRSRLLRVPSLRARYVAALRTIAEHDLDWANLGPFVAAMRDLIDDAVSADTKKLASYEAFRLETDDTLDGDGAPREGSLRAFIEKRRAFLLSHPEIDAAGAADAP